MKFMRSHSNARSMAYFLWMTSDDNPEDIKTGFSALTLTRKTKCHLRSPHDFFKMTTTHLAVFDLHFTQETEDATTSFKFISFLVSEKEREKESWDGEL